MKCMLQRMLQRTPIESGFQLNTQMIIFQNVTKVEVKTVEGATVFEVTDNGVAHTYDASTYLINVSNN